VEKGLKKDDTYNWALLFADTNMLGVSGTVFSEAISLDSDKTKKESRKEKRNNMKT
jgi:hypothetical protein